jgi:hypothetical protein
MVTFGATFVEGDAGDVDWYETVAAVVSIAIAEEPPRLVSSPGPGSVKTALFAAKSLIVPPLSERARVDKYSKSDEVCPCPNV